MAEDKDRKYLHHRILDFEKKTPMRYIKLFRNFGFIILLIYVFWCVFSYYSDKSLPVVAYKSKNGHSTCKQHKVMISVIVKDKTSWGIPKEPFRLGENVIDRELTFEDFMNMIAAIEYPKECLSLAFLVSDQEEYKRMRLHLNSTTGYGRKYLIYRNFDTGTSRLNRHDNGDKQVQRRNKLSEARNYLMLTALEGEDAVLWLDSDVIQVPGHALARIVKDQKDIVTLRCIIGERDDYDYNAWQSSRKIPFTEWGDGRGPDGRHMHDLRGGDEFDYVELDSVGGTFLYINADLILRGLVFSPIHIVGTKWSKLQGHDAGETESICYMARGMGYQCYGMPNLASQHIDEKGS